MNSLLYSFQFLWGWNVKDEVITLKMVPGFQFLWGWNPLEYTDDGEFRIVFFQFLWGWNHNLCRISLKEPTTFNSFEDETLKLMNLLRSFTNSSFNSFEDETFWNYLNSNIRMFLSIPLRMKRGNSPLGPAPLPNFFQFLWGWNLKNNGSVWQSEILLSIPLRMKHTALIFCSIR